MVLSSYDDEIYLLGSVHHVLKVGSHLSSQTKKLQWLTIRNGGSSLKTYITFKHFELELWDWSQTEDFLKEIISGSRKKHHKWHF